MPRLSLLILSLCILFLGCNSTASNNKEKSANAPMVNGNWYKRYTGTIAGLPVVVNLYGNNLSNNAEGLALSGGTYYYSNKSEIIDLSVASTLHDTLILTESVSTEREDENNPKKPNIWMLILSDNTAKGKWIRSDQKASADIILNEDYTNACAFDIVANEDSVEYKGKHFNARCTMSFVIAKPAQAVKTEDAAFITSTLLHDLGGDTIGAKTIEDYIRIDGKRHFDKYNRSMTETDKDSEATASETNNWDASLNITPLYNDHGFVVMDEAWYVYTGGAHGAYGTNHLCIDVQDKRAWRLDDIINVDTIKLSNLLEAEIRKSFGLGPNDKLSSRLLVDTVPITGNIAISDKGLLFYYNPYDIASFAQGQVCVFVSYTKLDGLLKEAFKKRMQL